LNEKLNGRISLAILITIVGIYLVNRGYQLKTSIRTKDSVFSFTRIFKLSR
jgi:hypothetical protein